MVNGVSLSCAFFAYLYRVLLLLIFIAKVMKGGYRTTSAQKYQGYIDESMNRRPAKTGIALNMPDVLFRAHRKKSNALSSKAIIRGALNSQSDLADDINRSGTFPSFGERQVSLVVDRHKHPLI